MVADVLIQVLYKVVSKSFLEALMKNHQVHRFVRI